MTIVVRPEQPGDFEAVRGVVARAFTGAAFSAPPVDSDGAPGEATLVGWLRESASYDPRFAFVAVDDGEAGHEAVGGDAVDGDRAGVVVGHVMATWGDLSGTPVLGLGPLSVEPGRQGQGVGSALMRAALAAAREAGESVVVLLGDPGYYSRFGFVSASTLGITADPQWGEFFQACPLRAVGDEGAAAYDGPRGVYTYAEPFARLG